LGERSLFITGASGFIGRRLCYRLAGKGAPRLLCLSRNLAASPERNATWINGSLLEPQRWTEALRGVDAVVHLAAQTGKGAPEEFERTNVEGTRALIDACRAVSVRRLCFVSTIAVRYSDLHATPYARSKLAAEELVRASGLEWTIVRPTIVLGPRSKAGERLAALARLPLIPAFGGARARVQPVHVDDLALALARWFDQPAFDGVVHEIGGPEVLELRELLARIRVEILGTRGRLLSLPGKGLIELLWSLEGALRPVLPMTAAQMHVFVYDGVAQDGPLAQNVRAELTPLETMLRDLAGKPRPAVQPI
jgi:uncharacterized protein YbjT (DUF2867 family)